MPIKVADKQRPVGFKFILPSSFPYGVPYVYLDEPLNEEVISMLDYVDPGNRIACSFLSEWPSKYASMPQRFNLRTLLSEVY